MHRKQWFFVVITLFGGVLLTSCGDESVKAAFYDACDSDSDCPSAGLCARGESGQGTVDNVCTIECETTADCRTDLGRSDVLCLGNICAMDCDTDSMCPSSQRYCRGSDPSCWEYGVGSWCASEDFFCKSFDPSEKSAAEYELDAVEIEAELECRDAPFDP